jgi:hypothetical protein
MCGLIALAPPQFPNGPQSMPIGTFTLAGRLAGPLALGLAGAPGPTGLLRQQRERPGSQLRTCVLAIS